MKLTLLVTLLLALLSGCSNPPAQSKAVEPQQAVAPQDQSRHFPMTGQINMEIVPEHLLGKDFMPGGNLAEYRVGKSEYRQFLGKMPDAQTAAFLLLDWKKTLKDAQYIANMGGYYGMDGDRPVYVFTKGVWVAGIVGLPQAKADVVARQFAARL